ncbi:MAG: transcriptional attenuator, LytR family [Actinomycetia bacterium]|nr:transcriptional attenuator, LytR family [Actinomycetes bacterium]
MFTSSGIGAAYWFANSKWDKVHVAPIPAGVFASPERGKPANYLIIGSDTRSDLTSPQDVARFGGSQGPPRSDTIMIAHVDPATQRTMLVSFPRDLWVNVPGRGMKKMNAAFNDGPAKVIQTISSNFDIPIHHYLEVDIAGFRNLVNAIGTVPIYFPTPARDEATGLQILLPGCYHFNGDDAVAYVRSREYEYKETAKGNWKKDPTFDLGRIRRQQYFIRSLAQVAINSAAKHPLNADNVLNKVFAPLTRDRNLGLSDMRALAVAFRSTDPASVQMLTVPSTPDHIQGQDVLLVDQAGAAPVFEQLRSIGPKAKPLPVPKDVVPNQVTVKVLNGSGVQGAAKSTMDALQISGFHRVDPQANADRSDYQATEVRYVRGALHKAQLVAAYLGAGKLVAGKSVAGADVTVVLGADFKRVTVPTTLPPTSPPTTVTANGSSTTTTGQAANPGRTPGAKTQPVVGC